MPVTVVVGGQFGSEGKGKVAHALAGWRRATTAVRVGGANSGHTVVESNGNSHVFRQLPTAVLHPGVHAVIPAGSYIDLDVLHAEIKRYHQTPASLSIDLNAVIITQDDRAREEAADLQAIIGSTLSGTGAAVAARIARDGSARLARDEGSLAPFLRRTRTLLRSRLDAGERVVVEGTQGYGLSVFQADDYPYATSRDTSAAAFISEAGLSPTDVDEIVLVLRAFPIRVGGNSGPLPRETTWEKVTRDSGSKFDLVERTTVTGRTRRVGMFDPAVVTAALEAHPTALIALNHLDHVDSAASGLESPAVRSFIEDLEAKIGREVTWLGFSPSNLIRRDGHGTVYRLRVQ